MASTPKICRPPHLSDPKTLRTRRSAEASAAADAASQSGHDFRAILDAMDYMVMDYMVLDYMVMDYMVTIMAMGANAVIAVAIAVAQA
jgi:uncharacterized membrane protein